jgi:hypothetical protein
MGKHTILVQPQGSSKRWPAIAFVMPLWRPRKFDDEQPVTCPLRVENPQRGLHVRLSVVGSWRWPSLSVAVRNCSATSVHSFAVRFLTTLDQRNNGIGVQPEDRLRPGEYHRCAVQEPVPRCVGARVDFVQFSTGDVWCTPDRHAIVTEAGLAAGSSTAVRVLREVLTSTGPGAVMKTLPRLHAVVPRVGIKPRLEGFGFYAGVTRVAVGLQHAFDRLGLDGVAQWLDACSFDN